MGAGVRECRYRHGNERQEQGAGMGQRPSSGALIGGIVLLIVGGAFLLRNAGLISVDWGVIWPAIVIAIGAALIVAALTRRDTGPGETTVAVAADGARSLDLVLRVGAGQYRLGGGSGSLVEVASNGPTIAQRVDRSGDAARVRLATAVDSWSWGRMASGIDWRIGVASGVPVRLDVQAGAGSFTLDLEHIAVTAAQCSIGAAELRVILPRPRGEVPIRIEGGAASFVVEVPPGVEASVGTSGLVTTSGPNRTPGYATAADRVTVSVSGGVAAVRVVHRAA
jgi:hypothetical protein